MKLKERRFGEGEGTHVTGFNRLRREKGIGGMSETEEKVRRVE